MADITSNLLWRKHTFKIKTGVCVGLVFSLLLETTLICRCFTVTVVSVNIMDTDVIAKRNLVFLESLVP